MAQGKDPETADFLGGVHKVVTPRQPAPETPRDPHAVAVGDAAGRQVAHLIDDEDQLTKVVHTVEAPVEPPNDTDARESALRPTRTPEAPFQDARIAPDGPSAWSAEKTPRRD